VSTGRDPDNAPRGKHFAVAKLTHVAGTPRPCFVMQPGWYDSRSEAQAAADRIDWRLEPCVLIVDNLSEDRS
jgi:hypothetical protein